MCFHCFFLFFKDVTKDTYKAISRLQTQLPRSPSSAAGTGGARQAALASRLLLQGARGGQYLISGSAAHAVRRGFLGPVVALGSQGSTTSAPVAAYPA